VVVLDAGHGGIDGGAEGVNSKVKESELNLKICLILKEIFEKHNFKVVMIRDKDEGLYGNTSEGFKKRDLLKRVQIANGCNANLFLSIHLNVYKSPSRRGAQVFFKKGDKNSQNLADNIQTELNLLKESKRMYDAITGDYYLLNQIKCSSCIIECGFLSNPEEEKLLLTEEYRQKIANSIFKGSLRYLSNLQ
jgi:N-acetylmuramoyl-L-alanine amidase